MDISSFILGLKMGGGGGGGSSVTVESLSVTENGTTTAPTGKAYSPVVVNVPNSYSAGDEGKVVSNGALVAQSSDTVTANDTYDTTLINSLTVNVAGGGGGLEYEEGTWTPNADEARPTINFAKSHTTPPALVMMADTSATATPVSGSNLAFVYADWNIAFGNIILPEGSSTNNYGTAEYLYNSASRAGSVITTLSSTTNNSSRAYWVNNTSFRPSTASTSRYWKAGRTYKWIAVWAPES